MENSLQSASRAWKTLSWIFLFVRVFTGDSRCEVKKRVNLQLVYFRSVSLE
jgi:hypothetical protein